MNLNSKILQVFIILQAIFGLTCKDSNPVLPTQNTRSPRDYTWSIDSIDYSSPISTPARFTGMWGSSNSNVWGVAGDGVSPDDALWYYNGNVWRRATEGTIFTDHSGNRFVYDIWGTDANNIWAVGRKINFGILSAMIVHYNGTTWQDVTPVNVQNINGVLYTIHAIAPNNIWAAGYEYAIHYDGASWQTYKVADSMIVRSIAGQGSQIYLTAYSPWGIDLMQLYRFNGATFSILDKTDINGSKFGGELWLHNEKLIAMGYGIFSVNVRQDGTIDTSTWQLEYDTGIKGVSRSFIFNSDNVLAVGSVYLVCHFNGTNWEEINIRGPNDPGNSLFTLSTVWTNGSEAFISNYHEGIIYHGE